MALETLLPFPFDRLEPRLEKVIERRGLRLTRAIRGRAGSGRLEGRASTRLGCSLVRGARSEREKVGQAPFGLGFNTLPVVFAQMGAFGNLIGAVWFFMLFLAAITSSLSMYQPSLAFFRESLGLSRKAGTLVVVAIAGIGSFLTIWFSKDGVFLGTLDNWVGTFLVFVLATGQIVMFSWIFGVKRGMKEAHQGAEIRIPDFYRPIIRWVSPIYLLIIFVAFCVMNLGDWIRGVGQQPAAQLALALVGAVAVMLLVMVRIGEKRWRAAGIDIDDRNPATYEE